MSSCNEIEKWMDDVINDKISVKHPIHTEQQKKEIKAFLKQFNENYDKTFSISELQSNIIKGNMLALDQGLDFMPHTEILDLIHFACQYGHLNSVIWFYKNYDCWFTDDCFLLAGQQRNNQVIEWLLNNANNIEFRKEYIKKFINFQNYEALTYVYKHKSQKESIFSCWKILQEIF